MIEEQKKPLLTIVCPVHNEETVIPLFINRILPVRTELLVRYNVNILFINNSSTDDSYEVILTLRQRFPFIYVITLSSNVGYQRSLDCGLRNAKGDVICFIDVDCEDPPEMLANFIALYEKGYDLVYGERVDRVESLLLKKIRKFFYHLVKRVADDDIILYMAEFSLFTSEVRDAIISDNNSFPFIRSSISRVGFNRIGIPYKRHARIAGQTHYNFIRMFVFAVAGILTASTLPLRAPIFLFPFWLALSTGVGIFCITMGNQWLLLSELLLFFIYFGFSISFIALYVARIYKNGLGRPNFIIHRRYSHLQPN